MSAPAAPSTTVVLPSGGRTLRAFGDEVTFLLGAAETDGKYTMALVVTVPGGGPPPHSHLNEDEWFYVMEGRVEFLKDGAWSEVPVGSSVFIPRGVVHAFRNPGSVSLRLLVHAAPCGFEAFFTRASEVFAQPGPPDIARIMAIAGEHGIQFA